jgi:hypothetical protein
MTTPGHLQRTRRQDLGTPNHYVELRLLTAEEIAVQTGLSVETLAQWRSQRKGIPYIKISRNCVRYRQCDLDGWISERIVRTDESPIDRR